MDPMQLTALTEAVPQGKLYLPKTGIEATAYTFIGVSTDTRKLKPSELFVALKGTRFNGHDYLQTACEKGAAALLISEPERLNLEDLDRPVLVVDDTLAAYQALAHAYRLRSVRNLIAVTGSVGKTSTREMIACAIQPTWAVHRTQGNLNNEIGVPATLLDIRGACEAAVIEMGMDRPGDIALLSRLAEPDFAVITGIGYSHLAYFETQEGLLRAKAEILEGLRPGGTLLLNAGDPLLRKLSEEQRGQVNQAFVGVVASATDYPVPQALEAAPTDLPGPLLLAKDLTLDEAGCASFAVYLKQPGQPEQRFLADRVQLPIAGTHHVPNALFGLLCAHLLGLPRQASAAGLTQFSVIGDRQRLVDASGLTLINDSYNAAPESMRASLQMLEYLSHRTKNRAIALLGGIAELGPLSASLHYALGETLAKLDLAEVHLLGEQSEAVKAGFVAGRGNYPLYLYETRDQLVQAVLPRLKDRDLVLVKGSHAYRMDQVAQQILEARLEALS